MVEAKVEETTLTVATVQERAIFKVEDTVKEEAIFKEEEIIKVEDNLKT